MEGEQNWISWWNLLMNIGFNLSILLWSETAVVKEEGELESVGKQLDSVAQLVRALREKTVMKIPE
jgi:hypothetical protein